MSALRNRTALLLLSIGSTFMSFAAAAATTDLVKSYGSNGVATLPAINYGQAQDLVYASQPASNAKNYVFRESSPGSGNLSWTVYRLNADGTVDSSFSSSGLQFTHSTSNPVQYHGFYVDESRQRIYLLGIAGGGNDAAVVDARTFTGNVDASFGSSGRVVLQSGECDGDYATPDASGMLLISFNCNSFSTSSPSYIKLARLTPSGTFDTSFGAAGISSIQYALNGHYGYPIAPIEVTAGGEIVMLTNVGDCCSDAATSPTGSVLFHFPHAGYTSVQPESSSNETALGSSYVAYGITPSGSGAVTALVDSAGDKTFKTLRVDANRNVSIADSAPEPSFAYVTGGQNTAINTDGSILIGGSGPYNSSASQAPVAKLSGNTFLVPVIPAATSPVVGSSSTGGGIFSLWSMLALMAGAGWRRSRRFA